MFRKLTLLALASSVLAQGPIVEFDGIERDWPQIFATSSSGATIIYGGTSTAMAVGAFVPGHPGRCVVVVRGGQTFMSFQPVNFDHLVYVPQPDLLVSGPAGSKQTIGSLPQFGGGASRLAALVPGGLDIWEYDPTDGFESVLTGPDPEYVGATNLRTGVHRVAAGLENHFVAFNSSWVQGGIVLNDDTIVPGLRSNAPAGAVVLDAVVVDWEPGGLPEIAVLLSYGFAVVDVLGNVVDSRTFATPVGAGKLCVFQVGAEKAMCAVVEAGPLWLARTWKRGVPTVNDTPAFALPGGPVGLDSADLNGDGHEDIVLSSSDSVRPVMFGTSNGPALSGSIQVRDSSIGSLVVPAVSNVVGLVLDDIDRDGTLDFIVQSDATNQLIVLKDASTQTQNALGMSMSAVQAYTLSEPEVLFQMQRPSLLPAPAHDPGFTFPFDHEGLALRFTLPPGLEAGMVLQVYVYPIGNDSFSPVATGSYRAILPTTTAGSTIDVLIPTDVHNLMPLNSQSEVLMEFSVVQPLPDGIGVSTQPVCCKYSMYQGSVPPVSMVLNHMVDPENPLWFVGMDYGISNWGLLLTEPAISIEYGSTVAIVSSRYIGTLETTGDMDADVQLPKTPPVESIPAVEPQ